MNRRWTREKRTGLEAEQKKEIPRSILILFGEFLRNDNIEDCFFSYK